MGGRGVFSANFSISCASRRKEAMINMDIVYGDKKTPAEKNVIYKGCCVNVARQAVNYLRAPPV